MGRDIEFRELELERNGDNVWELISDSKSQPELLEDRIVVLLSVLLKDQREFIGTPTELSQKIDPDGQEGITPKKVARLILQSVDTSITPTWASSVCSMRSPTSNFSAATWPTPSVRF